LVELLRRYSNRGDLLDDLNRALARLDGRAMAAADEEPLDDLVSACQCNPRERLLSERLTPRDMAAMLERYRSGESAHELAVAYKIGETSLKRLVKLHGGRPADERYTPEGVAAVLGRYRAGDPIRGLAAEFGIGVTTLKRWIREHGVKRGRSTR
jgi:hypothetical protein